MKKWDWSWENIVYRICIGIITILILALIWARIEHKINNNIKTQDLQYQTFK